MNRNKSIANPQNIINIPYAIYNTHKNARRQIQSQREQTQHTISYLERQAKRSAKELESKEKSLLNYYRLKQSRLQEHKIKEQCQERSEKQLDMQRKINLSNRQISSLKKNLIKKDIEVQNKKRVEELKSYRSSAERKLSQERQLERSLLRKRNNELNEKLITKNQHSRVKSRQTKIAMSNVTKNDLISVQNNIKQRELETIAALKRRQQQLEKTIDKNKKQHLKYENRLTKIKSYPFEEISQKLKSGQSQRGRRTSSGSDSYL